MVRIGANGSRPFTGRLPGVAGQAAAPAGANGTASSQVCAIQAAITPAATPSVPSGEVLEPTDVSTNSTRYSTTALAPPTARRPPAAAERSAAARWRGRDERRADERRYAPKVHRVPVPAAVLRERPAVRAPERRVHSRAAALGGSSASLPGDG